MRGGLRFLHFPQFVHTLLQRPRDSTKILNFLLDVSKYRHCKIRKMANHTNTIVLTSGESEHGPALLFLPDVGDALQDPAAAAHERRDGDDQTRVEDQRPHDGAAKHVSPLLQSPPPESVSIPAYNYRCLLLNPNKQHQVKFFQIKQILNQAVRLSVISI